MIVPRQGFTKRYTYGGSGIFDSITKLLMRLFTSNAAKQLASSAIDVGKSVAKEGAKKALEQCRNRCRKEVSPESVNS